MCIYITEGLRSDDLVVVEGSERQADAAEKGEQSDGFADESREGLRAVARGGLLDLDAQKGSSGIEVGAVDGNFVIVEGDGGAGGFGQDGLRFGLYYHYIRIGGRCQPLYLTTYKYVDRGTAMPIHTRNSGVPA